jgi:malate dehydrogenase
VLDFLESNVALQSKIMLVDYEEPKEMDQSDVVIVASGVENPIDASVPEPAAADIAKMEEIAAQIGHFAPTAMVAVLSQPAEVFCSVIARNGYLDASKVLGFPLLTYREWFRDHIAQLVGLSNEDVRITTVRTLSGEELVPSQCTVGGVPLPELIPDLARLPQPPGADVTAERLKYVHYAPAAIVAGVTSELVSKRGQIITAICPAGADGSFVETKAIFGPQGFERALELDLTAEQRERHEAYRKRVAAVTASTRSR